jgi:transposase
VISADLEAHILRLHHAEKWKIGTIAAQLHVHHSVVKRVLYQSGAPRPRPARSSALEVLLPFIEETLRRFPRLPASRLYEMCRQRGHKGSSHHFRHFIALVRPRPAAEAYLRLKTLPGGEAQVDWGHFGFVSIGRARRPLLAFVMVLSWSRQIFVRFYLAAHTTNFLRGHQAAFESFGGVPRVLLYDNLKSAVLERVGDAIRFNPRLLELAKHHHFEPRPVAKARGNEKGRVERAIGYLRRSFFEGRSFADVADLNAQAESWCQGPAGERRCAEDESLSVAEAFLKERPQLMPLSDAPLELDEQCEVSAGKTPYVRFDWNDYSLPHGRVRRLLVVRATLDEVRIIDGTELVARHARSFDRGAVIEDPAHIEALVDEKRHARTQRGLDRLTRAVPRCEELFKRFAARGFNLGFETQRCFRLLDEYGPQALDEAIREALANDVPHYHALRHILERARRARGEPPSVPVVLPNDPRVRGLVVRAHELSSYDQLIAGSGVDAADAAERADPRDARGACDAEQSS